MAFRVIWIYFILGALGFEMIGAPRVKNFGRADYLYAFFTTVEESLEFIGIILFNYSLITYIEEHIKNRKKAWAIFDTKEPRPN